MSIVVTRRVWSRFFLTALIGLFLIAGCGPGGQQFRSTSSAEPPQAVRIGSFSVAVDYAPYLVARSHNWFEEAFAPNGIDVEYTTFQSLAPINESFATGRIDVVFEAEPPAIIGRAAGIDVRVMGISCSLEQEIIVPTDSPVRSIADLSGKTIAVLAGTSSHYGVLQILGAHGVPEDQVTLIDMAPADAKNAFETGQVDAWAVWPPWVEQEIITEKGRILSGGNARIHSIMAVRGAFADTHPAMLRTVTDVIERAKSWIEQNPDAAQRTAARELGLDPRIVELAWPKHNWRAELAPAVISDIQAKADFLLAQQMVRARVDVARDLVRPVPAL